MLTLKFCFPNLGFLDGAREGEDIDTYPPCNNEHVQLRSVASRVGYAVVFFSPGKCFDFNNAVLVACVFFSYARVGLLFTTSAPLL